MPPQNQIDYNSQVSTVAPKKSKLNTILLIILILIAGFIAWKFFGKDKETDDNPAIIPIDQITTTQNSTGQNYSPNQEEQNYQPPVPQATYKKVARDNYSFEAPTDWIVGSPKNFEGCLWQSVSNNGDGNRMVGEVGIYPKSCFDLSKAVGKKEYTEKNGYYIVAYYDRVSGTTAAEELETKQAYQKIVDTFAIN